MAEYHFREIEKKWQKYWQENQLNKVSEDHSKPKYYVLDMFPYPSGSGLHVGHPLGYIASDIVARYKRLKNFNVLHPMGFDAFGLPAEQYAIQTGQHPAVTTKNNIQMYKKQLNNIGFSYDWSREVQTCDPDYYRWTQWIFIELFNSFYDKNLDKARPVSELVSVFEEEGNINLDVHCTTEEKFTAEEWNAKNETEKQKTLLNYRLAYLAETTVNWCQDLGTVLANEEVKDGLSERGGYPVIRKKMQQWFLRITSYADRLLRDLDTIDWSDAIKEIQRNWIGKSEGALVNFKIENSSDELTIFTTRPDTIFGATFMVLAPEHELVDKIVTAEFRQRVTAYAEKSKNRSERERMSDVKTITGEFTGAYAIHPFSGEKIPLWVADYVLAGYGTGAVMAVPAHDSRDFAFAKHFNLPIKRVVSPAVHETVIGEQGPAEMEEEMMTESHDDKDGIIINSDFLNGLPVKEAMKSSIKMIEENKIGRKKVNFRLRDAGFGRQRYWGEPFPVIYKDGIPFVVNKSNLPVTLPEVESYKPTGTGESPLAAIESWVNEAEGFKRETDTMPGWAGSSWYFLRYMDPHNKSAFAGEEALDYWQNVDLYIGGAEHATGHLLYSRFWMKFLFDLGYVKFSEPFKKLINQGMILGENGEKMSKSKGNVVNPDEIVEKYGADTLRLYEMFLGPLEQYKPWNTNGMEGVYRFLNKLWRLFHNEKGEFSISDEPPTPEELKIIHKTIKKAEEDIEKYSFNTSVSFFMICVNELSALKCNKKSVLENLLLILSPYAPHICEELWQLSGNSESIYSAKYPDWNPAFLVENTYNYPVSINGKVRTNLEFSLDTDFKEIESQVLSDEMVKKWMDGKTPKKVIIVKGKIVNLVI